MNSEHEIVVRQLQHVQQWPRAKILERREPPWAPLQAARFEDRRCPICGRFNCGGC